MSCEEMEMLISAMLDGELDASGTTDVEEHLQTCPACRRTMETYRGIGETFRLRNESKVEAPIPDVVSSQPAIRFPVFLRIAALIALVAAVVLLLDRGQYGPSSEVPAPEIPLMEVTDLQTDLPDATLVVYKDLQTDWLIILVDDPSGEAG